MTMKRIEHMLRILLAIVPVLVLWPLTCLAQVPAAADPIDVQRAERYVARLKALGESRIQMRERAASLVAQNPVLEQAFLQSVRAQLATTNALALTPDVTVTPQLLQTWQLYRGQSGQVFLQPEWFVWYALQDNTLFRQRLFIDLFEANRDATQTAVTLESGRVAMQQIIANADANFLDFRSLGDLLGRRSPQELFAAEQLSAALLQSDPLHAGAALVRAHALRAMGRYDESLKLLAQLDQNYPAMQSIAGAVGGQIAFMKGNLAEATRLLDRAAATARDAGAHEAFLVQGWIYMAQQKWSQARTSAERARTIAPDDLEVAILLALSRCYEKPNQSRDSLKTLRRTQLNATPDDWHYHEALAIAHAFAQDRQFAKREIATALINAPTHIRDELIREQKEIDAGKVPQIDWQARLSMQWLP